MTFWIAGMVLAFTAGYLVNASKQAAVLLLIAGVAISYIEQYLWKDGEISQKKEELARSEAKIAYLHTEIEALTKENAFLKEKNNEIKKELQRLRELVPSEERDADIIKRAITEVGEDLADVLRRKE